MLTILGLVLLVILWQFYDKFIKGVPSGIFEIVQNIISGMVLHVDSILARYVSSVNPRKILIIIIFTAILYAIVKIFKLVLHTCFKFDEDEAWGCGCMVFILAIPLYLLALRAIVNG